MLNRLHSQFELPNTYKKEDFDKMETTYTESDYTKNTTMNETLLLIKKSGKKNFDYEN